MAEAEDLSPARAPEARLLLKGPYIANIISHVRYILLTCFYTT